MMSVMGPTIRPLAPWPYRRRRRVLAPRLGAGVRVFRAVLGEQVYQVLYPDWATSQAGAVEAVCQDGTAQVWVAERDGRPVGYVAVRIDSEARTGKIDMLAVEASLVCPWSGTTRGLTPTPATRRFLEKRPSRALVPIDDRDRTEAGSRRPRRSPDALP
jgi:hypothetical protein